MPFLFKPAILKNSQLYELPRPLLSLRIHDAWDVEQLKVPLADGDALVGHSRQGVDISLEGQIGTQAGDLKATEEQMFLELENLRNALNVESPGDKFDFFLYHDVDTATYRRFTACTTLRFEYDLSHKNLFTYSALLHAEDPVLYDTLP